MPFFDIIFADAPAGGLVEIGEPGRTQWVSPAAMVAQKDWPQDIDFYYSPALRSRPGSEKADVLASRVIWADYDLPDDAIAAAIAYKKPPRPTIPPSIIVFTGWGWHYYWVLKAWTEDGELLETINKLMMEDINGDHCWNSNRLLRVPGTFNYKHGDAVAASIVEANGYTYTTEELLALKQVAKKTRHKIRTGDSRGYPSRSERDFAVARELLGAGVSHEVIRAIFEYHSIGDKYRDADGGGEKYLARTLEKAQPESLGAGGLAAATEVEERDDGYYVVKGRASRRISTFVLDPILLLQGDDQDALICDVRAGGYTWKGVTFTRNAFNGRNAMDKETRLASWQVLGRDEDVRILLPYILGRLASKGFPRIRATSTLGLHLQAGRHWLVGQNATLGASGPRTQADAPIVYLDTKREAPQLRFWEGDSPDDDGIRQIGALLPRLNADTTIWPTIGWYFATPFKTAIEAHGLRFPILNLFGTRGSGKTTSILRVFLPLLGQVEPKSYDANTTKFVVLSLLGSSNALPVAFSEFRAASVGPFIRYILLAYDTGHDPRGRPDQTTQDYPLSAPFSIDGEDAIDDAACRERMVAVDYHPSSVAEGTEAWQAYQDLQTLKMHFARFATGYLTTCLDLLDSTSPVNLSTELSQARMEVSSVFTSQLPDRIRNNLSVCWFGIKRFCAYTSQALPSPEVLRSCLENVFNSKMGRTLTLADEFTTDLINYLSSHKASVEWTISDSGSEAWFQMTPAYNWWVGHRRRMGAAYLGLPAVKTQLKESKYFLPMREVGKMWMVGIDLKIAAQEGLDLSAALDKRTLRVDF